MTVLYAALLLLLLVAIGLGLVTGRKVAIADLGPEVGSAHFKRQRPLAIAMAGGAVLFAVGVWLLPYAKLSVLAETMFLLLSGFAWSALTILLLRRRSFGRVLLRLPRTKANSLYMVFGSLFLVLGLLQLLVSPSHFVQGIGGISLGILLGVFGLIPFEIRDGGISILDNVVSWSRVRSYGWEGTERAVLTLEVSRRPRPFRAIRYKVPAERREALISILKDKVAH